MNRSYHLQMMKSGIKLGVGEFQKSQLEKLTIWMKKERKRKSTRCVYMIELLQQK